MAAVNVNELAAMLSLIEMNARSGREMLLSSQVVRQRSQSPGLLLGGVDTIARIQNGKAAPSESAQMMQAALNMSERAKAHVSEVLAFCQQISDMLSAKPESAPQEAGTVER